MKFWEDLLELWEKLGPVGRRLFLSTLILAAGISVYGYVQFSEYRAFHLHALRAVEGGSLLDPAAFVAWHNLQAQQDLAEWTFALFWLGIVGLVTSLAGIGLVFMNLLALNEQNQISRQHGEAQLRPYLLVGSGGEVRVRLHDESASEIDVVIPLRNCGKSPAFGANVECCAQVGVAVDASIPFVSVKNFDFADLAPLGEGEVWSIKVRIQEDYETTRRLITYFSSVNANSKSTFLLIELKVAFQDFDGRNVAPMMIQLWTEHDVSRDRATYVWKFAPPRRVREYSISVPN